VLLPKQPVASGRRSLQWLEFDQLLEGQVRDQGTVEDS